MEIKMIRKAVLAVLAAAILHSSCGFGFSLNDERVRVTLPVFSEEDEKFFGGLEFTRWFVQIKGEGFSDCFYFCGSEFDISAKRNDHVSVTALPLFVRKDSLRECEREVCFFCCAGGILPYCVQNEDGVRTLCLTWQDGFCAAVMQKVFAGSSGSLNSDGKVLDFVRKFNWQRLIDTVREKTEKSIAELEQSDGNKKCFFYNPWLLDMDSVVCKLAQRTFSASLLAVRSEYNVDCSNVFARNEVVASSYFPENRMIQEFGVVCVKKNCDALILLDGKKCVSVNSNGEKNLSVRSVNLPIFCKDYEDLE